MTNVAENNGNIVAVVAELRGKRNKKFEIRVTPTMIRVYDREGTVIKSDKIDPPIAGTGHSQVEGSNEFFVALDNFIEQDKELKEARVVSKLLTEGGKEMVNKEEAQKPSDVQERHKKLSESLLQGSENGTAWGSPADPLKGPVNKQLLGVIKTHPSELKHGTVFDKSLLVQNHELLVMVIERLGGKELVETARRGGLMLLTYPDPMQLAMIFFETSEAWVIRGIPHQLSQTFARPREETPMQSGWSGPTAPTTNDTKEVVSSILQHWLESNGVKLPGASFGTVRLPQ